MQERTRVMITTQIKITQESEWKVDQDLVATKCCTVAWKHGEAAHGEAAHESTALTAQSTSKHISVAPAIHIYNVRSPLRVTSTLSFTRTLMQRFLNRSKKW